VDIESSTGTGAGSFTWRGHFVVGWEGTSYRGLVYDNIGLLIPLACEFHDTTFVALSVEPVPLLGHSIRARFTWDFSDPAAVRFTNEHEIDDAPWQLWEEQYITPT
jgi:hypothetical protein